jgi:pyrroloquinoline quinone biosynthesis protein D
MINQTPSLCSMYRFQWEEAQGNYVLLYPEGMVKLSRTAGEVLKRVTGDATVKQLVSALQRDFPESDLENDVIKFLTEAKQNGWISF